ncbi:hypothetical protein CHUAL_009195 [Chamberlinius hualienensis]
MGTFGQTTVPDHAPVTVLTVLLRHKIYSDLSLISKLKVKSTALLWSYMRISHCGYIFNGSATFHIQIIRCEWSEKKQALQLDPKLHSPLLRRNVTSRNDIQSMVVTVIGLVHMMIYRSKIAIVISIGRKKATK